MTHDQLARVFPDGRTVHVPSDGGPLKGYELARADIEKRGNGDASSIGKQGLFAALLKGKSTDDEDEAASAPMARVRTASAALSAGAAPARSADPVPLPHSKPAASFQLASADVQAVQAPKRKQAVAESSDNNEPKPQTPADIINARGFWDDAPATPKQATPAQVAAIGARRALAAADPQSTASVSPLDALAYAPAALSPVERANVVTASAPLPRSVRAASASRNPAVATRIDQVIAKGPQDQNGVIATSTRISGSQSNDVWMRAMILAPSASASMSATVLGDTDMTTMREHFAKPQMAIAMTFSNDPQMGMLSDRFTGSATAKLDTRSFAMRTASLR
jgi:hypothetical protein